MNFARGWIITRLGIALAMLILAGCSRISREPTASDGPPSYGLHAIALEEYWSRALSIAEEWRSDS